MEICKIVVTVLILYLTTGCASIMRGNDQQININAFDSKSGNIVSADCQVSNDAGVFRTRSGRSVIIGRDKDYLTVDCQTEELIGRTVIDGDVSVGYILIDFFLVDLCLISCWVDGFSGSWSEYPVMVDVPLDPKR
jgi:hypothetical protein